MTLSGAQLLSLKYTTASVLLHFLKSTEIHVREPLQYFREHEKSRGGGE